MDVINEILMKSLSRISNVYYDWGGQYQGLKSAENGFFSNFELNFCLNRSKETKINYPIVFSRSKFTRIDMSGLVQISWPSFCNTV